MKSINVTLLSIICLLMPVGLGAQVLDTSHKTDTLSFAERISFRTNMVDWALLIPNVGVEFDLRSTNWSRWAVGASVRGNWQTQHRQKRGMVYNLVEAKVELRNYWRTKQIGSTWGDNELIRYHSRKWDEESLAQWRQLSEQERNLYDVARDTLRRSSAFKRGIDRLFSQRRRKLKRPLAVWYRGVYASYSNYSLLLGSKGRQGDAISAGMVYGMVKPLYEFKNGNTLDFELGLSGGLVYARYDTYRHSREDDCYPITKRGNWHLVPFPMLTDVHAGFVYRLGDYPSTRKYRYRYDVDYAYREKLRTRTDSIISARRMQEQDEQGFEGVLNYYERMYQKLQKPTGKVEARRKEEKAQ